MNAFAGLWRLDGRAVEAASLLNQRPTWLANAHRDLDAAVAAAYGCPADISEEDALARLLVLNHARAAGAPAAVGEGCEPDEGEDGGGSTL